MQYIIIGAKFAIQRYYTKFYETDSPDIAEQLNGEVAGNPHETVTGVARIEYGKPGTACFLANMKYKKYLYKTKASIVLVNRDFFPEKTVTPTLVKVDNAYAAFARLMAMFAADKKKKGGNFRIPYRGKHI